MSPNRAIAIDEARLVLRWAAQDLTGTEFVALDFWLREATEREAAAAAGVSRGAIWMARRAAFKKMRKKLERIRITRVDDLLCG